MRTKVRKKIKRLRLTNHSSLKVCTFCEDEKVTGPCWCYVVYYSRNMFRGFERERLVDAPDGVIVIVGELDD